MSLTDDNAEPALVTVTVTLEHGAAELWHELKQRTGREASELVGWALGAYWREMEGIVLPPRQSQDEIDRIVAEGIEDLRAGRTISNDEVFAKLAVKHGW